MQNGLVWVTTKSGWRLGIPELDNLRSKIVHECHDARLTGHPGIEKTLDNVRKYFWWPTVDQDFRTYVEACHACERGGKHLVRNLEDCCSHYPFHTRPGWPTLYHAHKNITAKQTAQLLIREVVRLHGVPLTIVSDRDPRITSN
ncbi:pol polyprotein, partial [Cystoisospora suis]